MTEEQIVARLLELHYEPYNNMPSPEGLTRGLAALPLEGIEYDGNGTVSLYFTAPLAAVQAFNLAADMGADEGSINDAADVVAFWWD